MKGKSGSEVLGKRGARGEKNSFSKRFSPLASSFSNLFVLRYFTFRRFQDTVLDPRKMHPHFSVTQLR